MQNKAHPKSFLFNSFYNILGHFFPLLVGLISIPLLIQLLGLERFGILSVIWLLIGYFSLFDFGLSRIITVKISELTTAEKNTEANLVFWTSMRLIAIATLIGAGSLMMVTFFKDHFQNLISPKIFIETFSSLTVIALSLPAVTLTSGVKGALEADNKFLGLNIIQTLMGCCNFLVPLWVGHSTVDLFNIVLSLCVLRYFFLIIYFVYLYRCSKWIGKIEFLSMKDSIPLITSGGWYTVTNVVTPIMFYFDRFFLSALIPSSQLAFYTTPFEIVNKLLIIPSSVTRALFPILASQSKISDYKPVYKLSMKMIFVICGLTTLIGILLGYEALRLWIGIEFAQNSYMIFVILIIGFFMNALTWTPFNLIQAFQRPKVSALIIASELPFYCVLLFYLTKFYGLKGTALAWSLRNTVDFFVMTYYSQRIQAEYGT